MNEFRDQLGALAHNVSKDFERASADDSAALIRRAKRGRIVWTGTVGTAALASIGVLAIGGNAAARGVFGETISPAAISPVVSTSATPTPTPSESADDNGTDDSATHDANDDNGIDENDSDDSATHDANDDNGGDTAGSDDVNDDSGSGSDDSGSGSDDSGKGSDNSGSGGDDSGSGSDD